MKKIQDRMINSFILFLLFALAGWFIGSLTNSNIIAILLGAIAVIFWLIHTITWLFFWKCPYCDHQLHLIFYEHCPYCGNDLFHYEKTVDNPPYESKSKPIFKDRDENGNE